MNFFAMMMPDGVVGVPPTPSVVAVQVDEQVNFKSVMHFHIQVILRAHRSSG